MELQGCCQIPQGLIVFFLLFSFLLFHHFIFDITGFFLPHSFTLYSLHVACISAKLLLMLAWVDFWFFYVDSLGSSMPVSSPAGIFRIIVFNSSSVITLIIFIWAKSLVVLPPVLSFQVYFSFSFWDKKDNMLVLTDVQIYRRQWAHVTPHYLLQGSLHISLQALPGEIWLENGNVQGHL